jgi:hypothetical protein
MMTGRSRVIETISATAIAIAMTTRGNSGVVQDRMTVTHMISRSRETAPTSEGRSAIATCGTAAMIRATCSCATSTCRAVATAKSSTMRAAANTRYAAPKAARCRPPAPFALCPHASSATAQAMPATHATATCAIFANRGPLRAVGCLEKQVPLACAFTGRGHLPSPLATSGWDRLSTAVRYYATIRLLSSLRHLVFRSSMATAWRRKPRGLLG